MTTRRTFIKKSALAIGGLAFSQELFASISPAPRAIGLQLFTFFNEIDNDVIGTLKKIASVGYTEIESAFSKKGGYYGMKPKEFSSTLKDLGLTWKSHHVLGAPFKMPAGAKMPTAPDGKPIVIPPMKNLKDNMQELVDDVAEGGIPFLVCANTPINTMDDIKSSIDVLNKTGEIVKKAGLTFAYHNHDAEFKAVDGQLPYDMFLTQVDASLMKMELDLAWAIKGGKDPVEIFAKNPGRFPLWHVKDLSKDFQKVEPMGNGFIDFKKIFANASTAGMKHFFVEHDMPANPLESITTSFANLKKILSMK
jgi:sugar phosphate isomerase/epimerase